MPEVYAQVTERRDLNLTQIQALRDTAKLIPGMYYRPLGTNSRYYAHAIDAYAPSPNVSSDAPSMIDPNWYAVPAGSPASAYPPGWQSLNGSASENAIVVTDLPDGEQGLAWHCIPSGNSGADGGFNYGGNRQPVDDTKTYRICSWFRRNVNQQGSSYHGLYNYNAAGANVGVQNAASASAGANANFYMFHGDLPTADEWYMVVSYLRPANSGVHALTGGIYQHGDLSKKANTVADGRFVPGTVEISVRDYLYYATNPAGSSQHIVQPRIDLVDGNEPSLSELLGVGATLKQFEDADLSGAWKNYNASYQKLTAVVANGVVHLSGLVKAGTGEIARLPELYRPSGRVIGTQLSGSNTAVGRVDVTEAGQLVLSSGSNAWVAINMNYPAKWAALGENR